MHFLGLLFIFNAVEATLQQQEQQQEQQEQQEQQQQLLLLCETAPVLSAIYPNVGRVGDAVSISGNGFCVSADCVYSVTVGGVRWDEIVTVSENLIVARAPNQFPDELFLGSVSNVDVVVVDCMEREDVLLAAFVYVPTKISVNNQIIDGAEYQSYLSPRKSDEMWHVDENVLPSNSYNVLNPGGIICSSHSNAALPYSSFYLSCFFTCTAALYIQLDRASLSSSSSLSQLSSSELRLYVSHDVFGITDDVVPDAGGFMSMSYIVRFYDDQWKQLQMNTTVISQLSSPTSPYLQINNNNYFTIPTSTNYIGISYGLQKLIADPKSTVMGFSDLNVYIKEEVIADTLTTVFNNNNDMRTNNNNVAVGRNPFLNGCEGGVDELQNLEFHIRISSCFSGCNSIGCDPDVDDDFVISPMKRIRLRSFDNETGFEVFYNVQYNNYEKNYILEFHNQVTMDNNGNCETFCRVYANEPTTTYCECRVLNPVARYFCFAFDIQNATFISLPLIEHLSSGTYGEATSSRLDTNFIPMIVLFLFAFIVTAGTFAFSRWNEVLTYSDYQRERSPLMSVSPKSKSTPSTKSTPRQREPGTITNIKITN